jgi:hypothetical protein
MVFFVGGALQTFANGLPMMMLGRIIAGLGVGALSTIVPVYQSEISTCRSAKTGYRSVTIAVNLQRIRADMRLSRPPSQSRKTSLYRVHWEYLWIRGERVGRLLL